jgi:hypothetical protein
MDTLTNIVTNNRVLFVIYGFFLLYLFSVDRRKTVKRLKKSRPHAVDTVPEKQLSTPPLHVSESLFRHAWPLKQMVLWMEMNPEAGRGDLPPVLRELAERFTSGHIAGDKDGHIASGSRGSIRWGLLYRVTPLGPSFFSHPYGWQTRPGVYTRELWPYKIDWDDNQAHLVILLQGIRTTQLDTLADWLVNIPTLLGRGNTEGTLHEDDAGWSFRVFSADPEVQHRERFCGGIVSPVKSWMKPLLACVIGRHEGGVDIGGQEEMLYLQVALELEHLLKDHGLFLSANSRLEVPLPEIVLTQLVNMLLDTWSGTLPAHIKPEEKIAQIRMEIAAGESAQKVHRMLRRLRQRGLYVASFAPYQKVE